MNKIIRHSQITAATNLRWLALFLATVFAPMLLHATIVAPYTADANTLYLFHFDGAAGTSVAANAGSVGGNAYTISNAISGTVPTPSPVLTTMLGAGAFSGFGSSVSFVTGGYTVGYDANNSGAYQPDVSGSSLSPDAILMSSLNIGNGGQSPFTLEAMIYPSTISTGTQEIICTDSSAGGRGFQFRINTVGQLEFNSLSQGGDFVFNIPIAGPNAFVPNNWYHVAVTYDGITLRCYWTKVDPTVGQANLIGVAAATIGTTEGAASGPLCIGNENRNNPSEAFQGRIDEVRISNVARSAMQMIFSPRSSQTLTWVGDGANNAWADGIVSNWNNGTAADVFNAGDTITFNDTSANTNVSLWGYSLAPASVTISNTAKQYLLQGAGGIVGSGGLTKNGTGTLILGGTNSYTGLTTVSNGTVMLPSAPLLYMSFDNTNGTTVVNEGIGGSAMNGTLTGSATVVPGGRRGNALSIPSTGLTTSYVLVNNAVTLFNGATAGSAWTVAMWIKTSTAGGCFLYQGTGTWNANGQSSFFLTSATQSSSTGPAGGHVGGVRYGGGWMGGNVNVNDGNWHFISIADNAGAKTISVDGVVDTTYTAAQLWSIAASGTQIRIGGTADAGDGNVALNGLIDEVYIYNRALSQAELQGLMTLTNAPAGAVLPVVAPVLSPASPVSLVVSSSALNLNGYNETIAGLNGVGTVDTTLAGGTPTLTISNTGSSTFGGSINDNAGALALTKLGSGVQTLGGINGYNGNTTVSGGTLVVTNNGTINGNSSANLLVGTVSGQSAALYQSFGTTVSVTNGGGGAFQLGSTAGAYGYYNISGGTINVGGEIDPGGSGGGVGTFGQFDMSGGTVNLPNNGTSEYFLPNRGGSGEASVVNITGGTVQIIGGATPANNGINGLSISWAAGAQTNATTISGSGEFLTPSLTVKLNQGNAFNAAGNAGNVTSLNLNGGLLQTLGFQNGTAANNVNVNVNFNGGTLKAGSAGNASFLANLGGAYIYSGGATIDDNGLAITNGQALLTPSGNGIISIAVASGGSGYTTPPQVLISGGSGSNATAYATISGGAVTGIVVTSPGNNYSSSPTVALAGGGYTSAATVGTVSTAPNTSGGLTKLGSGTLTLTGVNTYTGNTVVGAGTLALSGSGSLASANIVASNNATLDVSALTSGFTLGAGQSLLGNGTFNGAVGTVSGAKIYAATDGGYGTNTFNNTLTLVSGAISYFDLGTTYNGANDLINVNGGLVDNGAVHINAPSTAVNLDTTQDYVLMTASGGLSGTVSSTPQWGVKPLNWRNFTVVPNYVNNTIQLHYTANTPPTAVGVASPTTVVNNQPALVSVAVTPGTGSIDPNTGVYLDCSSVGASSAYLVLSSVANVYTNTIVIPASTAAGNYTLNATVSDSTPLSGSAGVSLTLATTNVVWNGAGPDQNWDTNPNWVGTYAPGYVGDSLTFAGTAGLAPYMDNNYTVTGITFGNTAGSFNIGGNGGTLTLTANGVVNNSANPQTLNVPIALNASQTFNAASGDIDISGNISGGAAVTKTGTNTLNLSGNNSYNGLSSIQDGTLAVSSGGVVGTASQNIEIAPSIGQVAALNLTNGEVNALRVIVAGTSANNNSPGTGALNQSGGVINAAQWFTVGAGGSAVGNTGGTGVYNLTGGTLNEESQQLEVANFTNATGTVIMSGSSAINLWNNANISLGANPYSGNGAFIQNGGTVTFFSDGGFTPGGTGVLYLGKSTGFSSTLYTYNLNGGNLTVPTITSTSRNSQFYFNGGTLQAAKANANFLSSLTAAYVSTNGAIIDDGGNAVSVNQPLVHDPALGGTADGGLTKHDSGTLTLNDNNTYTGNTTVNGGTLKLGAPVLHMTFDNVNGITVKNQGSGGSAMDGTITGAATITSGGRFGNALSIPAGALTTAYVLVNNPVVPLNNADTWTVALWVKTSTAGGCYLYQGDGGWASGDTSFYLNNGSTSGTKAGGVRYAQGWETGTATVNDNNWHFVVMTCNNGSKAQYVDGALDALTVNSWNGAATASQVRIGGSGDGGDGNAGLNGLIDEVYMYNRALTQVEIQQLYNSNNSQILPTNTTVNVASGTLDVGGLAQTVGSLAGSGSVLLDDVAGYSGPLTVGNASNTEYDGVISDSSGSGSLIKVGTGILTFGGANTYGGITTVSNGTLLVNSSGSLAGSVTVASGANLGGFGTLSGAVTVNGNLSAGSNSLLGTLTINNNLTLVSDSIATFGLTTSAAGINDKVVVNGSLLNNNNAIHIRAPSTSANLDTSDYLLIDNSSGSGITGGFLSTPVWDVKPLNFANYTIQNNGSGQIVLHYSVATAPAATISAVPSTVSRNQGSLISVTVTPGSSGTIVSVTLDTSSIGGSSTLALNRVGASNVYTNTIATPATYSSGTYSFLATVTDSSALTGTAGTSLIVTLANDVWTGAGTDNNWDTNPNWINNAAPGYVGDGVTFAGTTDLSPNMDQNYTVSSVTFSNSAGSFNIGTGGNTLTITAGVTNNSASAQTLNMPVVLAAAQTINALTGDLILGQTVDNSGYFLNISGVHNTTLNNVVSDSGGLTKSGSGTLTLAANNSYTGNTTISAGTLNLTGTIASGSAQTLTVADTASPAVLNIASAGVLANGQLQLGNSGGGGSAGAVYNGGSFTTLGVGGVNSFAIGNASGGATPTNNSYGYFLNNTPDVTTLAEIGVAGNGGGDGVLEVSQGTVNVTNWLTVGRFGGNVAGSEQNGLLLIRNGTVNAPNNGVDTMRFDWSQNTLVQNSVLDMGAGASLAPLNGFNLSFNLHHANNANATTLVTLSGGASLQLFQIYSYYATPLSVVNLNNGILSPTANTASLLGSGLTGVYVHSGGVTFDTKGYNATNVASLLAPTGSGVLSIPLSTPGAGYIGRPIVKIIGGGGMGATAIAEWNPSAGTITNITITSPGSGYTSVPTATLVGGGFSSAATLSTPVIGAVTGGGLVKAGAGIMALSGANTYTGNTTVSNGTLVLLAGSSINNSANINVVSGATFDVSTISFALGSGQTLEGNGTVNGSVISSGIVAPGAVSTIGALTFNNNLTLNAGSITSVKLNKSLAPAATSDQIIISGAANEGGTLAVNNLGGALQVGDGFQLISAGSITGNFSSIVGSPGTGLGYSFSPASGVLSVVALTFPSTGTNLSFSISGNTLTLSWPTNYIGWLLQSNAVDLSDTNDWFVVTGSATTNQEVITVNPAQTNVFYRMKHP
jgi:autotransporter-associated beta strand protein